jgi:hypothetical protein
VWLQKPNRTENVWLHKNLSPGGSLKTFCREFRCAVNAPSVRFLLEEMHGTVYRVQKTFDITKMTSPKRPAAEKLVQKLQ